MELNSFPILETERFLLRKMDVADAPAVFDVFSDAAVTKDIGIEPFSDVTQAEQLIRFMNDLYEEKKAFRWGIIKKDEDTLIGTCGFNGWDLNRGARGEIAYDLNQRYWRRGYMTEVIDRVIRFGFETAGLYRIEAFTNIDAKPSIRFLQRMGFTEEGVLRGYSLIHGQYADQRCFSLLKNEWNN
ncbi:MAG TPA: GNAT family protein [Paenibacillus sp.]|nr:GNAT family protein [Paenibacillus sp.]